MDFFKKNKNVLIFFSLLIVVIYGLTLWGDFVLDDGSLINFQYILSNPLKIKQIFMLPYWSVEAGLYRPVVVFSYSLNYFLLGTSPVGFHFINLILYVLTGFFIFKFLEKLFGDRFYALLTSFIFLILPIHTEAVANIIGRAEIMALLFSVLFLYEIIKEKPNAWLSGLYVFLAIGSKETAIAALPVAILVLYFKEKNNLRKLSDTIVVFNKYFYAILSTTTATTVYMMLRFSVLGSGHFLGVETSVVENPLMFANTMDRFSTALSVMTMYIWKTFVPINLCSDYSYNQIPVTNFWHIQTLCGFVILLSALVSIFYFLKKRPVISLATAIFLCSFLPVSNFIFPIGTIAGERLMFFPSLGLVMIFALFLVETYKHLGTNHRLNNEKLGQKFFLIVLAGLSVFYLVITITRATDWLSEKRLFTSAAVCASHSVLSLSNMGTVYYFDGDYNLAEKELLAALAINDSYSKGLNNLGLVYWKMGKIEKAKEYYLKAMQGQYPYPGAYENMALLYLSQNNIDMAREWLETFFSGNEQAVNEYLKNYGITSGQ